MAGGGPKCAFYGGVAPIVCRAEEQNPRENHGRDFYWSIHHKDDICNYSHRRDEQKLTNSTENCLFVFILVNLN